MVLESLDEALTFGKNSVTVDLRHLESHSEEVSYAVDMDLIPETGLVSYIVRRKHVDYFLTDTFQIQVGAALDAVFIEEGGSLSQWDITNWGSTSESFVSMPTSITDSPNGLYAPSTRSVLKGKRAIDLTTVSEATLTYQAKWDIEQDFDYAQILISTDSVNFVAQCTRRTTEGSSFQPIGEPVYDGSQVQWVTESIDLTGFLGGKIWIQFVMVSDEFQEQDGFYIDDLYIRVKRGDSTSSLPLDLETSTIEVHPNPVLDVLRFETELEINDLKIFDGLGLLKELPIGYSPGKKAVSLTHLPKGTYTLLFELSDGTSVTRKVVKF